MEVGGACPKTPAIGANCGIMSEAGGGGGIPVAADGLQSMNTWKKGIILKLISF